MTDKVKWRDAKDLRDLIEELEAENKELCAALWHISIKEGEE
jgi:hypothetical protein